MNTVIENEVIKVYIVEGSGGGIGVGEHNILSSVHIDALPANVIAGDLILGNSTPQWSRFPIGVNGQVLKISAGYPVWSNEGGGTSHNLLSATHPDTIADSAVAGDMIYANATPLWSRLAKGTDDYILKMVSGLPAWVTFIHTHTKSDISDFAHNLLSISHGDTLTDTVMAGDLIFGNATPKWARLPKGTDGQTLNIFNGYPTWVDSPLVDSQWLDAGTYIYPMNDSSYKIYDSNIGSPNGGRFYIKETLWEPPCIPWVGQYYQCSLLDSVGLSSLSGKTVADKWNASAYNAAFIATSNLNMANSHLGNLCLNVYIPTGMGNGGGGAFVGGLPTNVYYQENYNIGAASMSLSPGHLIQNVEMWVCDNATPYSSGGTGYANIMRNCLFFLSKKAASNAYETTGIGIASDPYGQTTTYAPDQAILLTGPWKYGIKFSDSGYTRTWAQIGFSKGQDTLFEYDSNDWMQWYYASNTWGWFIDGALKVSIHPRGLKTEQVLSFTSFANYSPVGGELWFSGTKLLFSLNGVIKEINWT
jgi:hypothetical protein